MNTVSRDFHTVIVYTGHQESDELGPYWDIVEKRVKMFKELNSYREELGMRSWTVETVPGEKLVEVLKKAKIYNTLLVIPAGQSSKLDAVFTEAQKIFLKESFFMKGGRGYLTCGASYWVSKTRIWTEKKTFVKESTLPLFQGTSVGPLCPFPGEKYKVGFYSDALEVVSGEEKCTIYLSGGGSLIPDDPEKVKVLVKYPKDELLRLKIPEEKISDRENAAVLVSIGEGAAVLSMFHPYYSISNMDVSIYEKLFPDCGTNWKDVHNRLSSIDVRMRFILKNILIPLELYSD